MHNSALGIVVRAHLHAHAIPEKHLDVVEAHFAREMPQDLAAVVKPHAKERIGQALGDYSFMNCFLILIPLQHPKHTLPRALARRPATDAKQTEGSIADMGEPVKKIPPLF